MKLIIGLGNPGKKYENTRHNIGFRVLDELSFFLDNDFKTQKSFKGDVCSGTYKGNKYILLKPLTFMNLSGDSLLAVFNYYKVLIDDVLIVYDDMDIDVGFTKIKTKGSSAGHNGLKSIFSNMNTMNINRIKVGISRASFDISDYVLGKFKPDEKKLMIDSVKKSVDIVCDFISGISVVDLMNKYN